MRRLVSWRAMSPRSRTGLLVALLACACADDPASTDSTGPATDGPATSSTGDAPTAPTTTTSTTDGPDVTGDPTTDPAPTSDTGDPPTDCAANPVCDGPDSCGECSLTATCSAAKASCDATADDECNEYLQCTAACVGGEPCIHACGVAYADGYAPAWALTDCMQCDACTASCAATAGAYCAGGGGGPGQVTTCEEIGDCGLCSLCSVGKGCAAAVEACNADPQCLPYQTCHGACAVDDPACQDLCQDMYPNGYVTAWAQYDCAVCDECPISCPEQQPYCMAGGGGPDSECASNADCVELYDALPFCVQQECVECLSDDNCINRGVSTCQDGFCV